MKKKIIYASLILGIVFVGCKKEEIENQVDKQLTTSTVGGQKNEPKIGLASFDPNNATNNELITEIEDFQFKLEEESLIDLSVSDMIWYSEALLNYEIADVKEEMLQTKKIDFNYSVVLNSGKISSVNLKNLFNTIKSDVLTYQVTLGDDYPNILSIDVESGISNSEVLVQVSYTNISIASLPEASFNCSFSRNCYPNGQCIFRNSNNTGTDNCGTGLGSNDWLEIFSNSSVNSITGPNNSGGSGINSWVSVPFCGNQIYGKIFYTGIVKVSVENHNARTYNTSSSYPSGYVYQCLSRQWTNYQNPQVTTVVSGCVSKSEIVYYSNKAVNRAKSTNFYSTNNTNQNKRVLEFIFDECAVYDTRIWQNVTAVYGKCVYRNLDGN